VSEDQKGKPDRTGRVIDTWVGDKPRSSFEGWLRRFRRKYTPDQPDFRHYRGSAENAPGRTDPVAAYRFQRLTAQDLFRFQPFILQLALLGFDLRTFEGIDRFWRLSRPERDRLFYMVQDPDRFRDRIKKDFFEEFKRHFGDFQKRFAQFFEHIHTEELSFDPKEVERHYRFMGLDRSATEGEIKDRYRRLAFEFHPDHGGDEDRMKALNIAYAAVLRAAMGR